MYGVIALFDEKMEQTIINLWKDLKEKSISNYAFEVQNRRPHITLASYNKINKTDFIQLLDELYDDKKAIDIKLNAIGSFVNSGTLFFSPTVTKELVELHANHHSVFEQFNDVPNSLYLPNSWMPHCTIANRLTPKKLVEAFDYCSKIKDANYGKIKEIAIIETFNPGEAPIIYSKKLSAE